MDLTASSAVNLPIINANFRLVVVWMGVRSMRCTYSGARVPPRLTLTRNFVFFISFLMAHNYIAKATNNMEGNATCISNLSHNCCFLSGLEVFPAADFHPLSRPGTSDRFATVTARGIQRPTNV
jgi:hypothetical protein